VIEPESWLIHGDADKPMLTHAFLLAQRLSENKNPSPGECE
jgi:hypothetical protein